MEEMKKKDLDFSSHQSTFQCCGLLFVLVFNIVFSFGAELLSAACHIRCIDAFFFSVGHSRLFLRRKRLISPGLGVVGLSFSLPLTYPDILF